MRHYTEITYFREVTFDEPKADDEEYENGWLGDTIHVKGITGFEDHLTEVELWMQIAKVWKSKVTIIAINYISESDPDDFKETKYGKISQKI